MDLSHIRAKLEKPIKSKQTWSGVEVVDYFKEYIEIPAKGAFGYTTWLKMVKEHNISLYHAQRLVEIMKSREQWLLKEKGEKLPRGKWLFNRFRYEIKEKGVDKYIASCL